MRSGETTDRILPLTEACERFGNIHTSTAYRWRKQGHFPPIRKISGRKVGVLESELNIWIERFKR